MTNEPKMAPQAPASGAGDQSKNASDAKPTVIVSPAAKPEDKPQETKKI